MTPGVVDFLQNVAVGNILRAGGTLPAAAPSKAAPVQAERATQAEGPGPVRVVLSRGGRAL